MPIKRLSKTTTEAVATTPAKGTKKVTVVAPPAEAKTTAKAAAPKTPKATRNISKDAFPAADGTKRPMRIAEFQDYTLSINAKEKRTDKELTAIWQTQFPNAVAFTEHHVRGVRRDYNAGRHSKQYPGKKTGDAVSIPYGVKPDGKRASALAEGPAAKAKAETPAPVKAVKKSVAA